MYLSVLDATAGLGRDGFVLAALGAQVTMVERQELFAALLFDAHVRALAHSQWQASAQRVELKAGDALALMDGARQWDIVHLDPMRSEEHTSELQSLMRISYAVFCLKKK